MLAFSRVHPRFILLVAILIASSLLLLSSEYAPPLSSFDLPGWRSNTDPLTRLSSLRTEDRVTLADGLYNDTISRRKKLIHTYGPSLGEVEA